MITSKRSFKHSHRAFFGVGAEEGVYGSYGLSVWIIYPSGLEEAQLMKVSGVPEVGSCAAQMSLKQHSN